MTTKYNLPKIKAAQIIKSLNIRDSVDLVNYLEEICIERGAFVKFSSLPKGEGRCILKNKPKKTGVITVSQNEVYPGRTRFSIGHELGHFELHSNIRQDFNCGEDDFLKWKDEVGDIEIEANHFASELLLPSSFIVPEIKVSKPSFEMIEGLASKYQTSLTATAFKVIECTDFVSALVGHREGKIQYVKLSKAFVSHGLWIPFGNLPKHSVAEKIPQSTNTNIIKMSPDVWIEDTRNLGRENLYEENRYFDKLKFGLCLITVHL